MAVDYSIMTEEQIEVIHDYCKNDMKKLKNVCFLVWGRNGLPNCYHDDLYDDAMNVLSESVLSFNPKLNKNFNTYLVNNVRMSYEQWYRDNFLRLKRNNLEVDGCGKIKKDKDGKPIIIHNVSFDTPAEDGIDLCEKISSDFKIEDEIERKLNISLEMQRDDFSPEMKEYLFITLSKVQRKVLELMICGYTEDEIVELLHIDSALYKDSIAAIKSDRNTKKIRDLLKGGQANVK